jgi:hypothetical protein
VCVLILLTAIALVYWPSLWHAPHSDQLVYYVDTLGHESFLDLVGHTYSYNRTRLVQAGDTQLFRPMFFVWQAGLKAFAGAYLEVCQGLGVVLHAVVCVLLWLLLRRIFQENRPARGGRQSPARQLPFALAFFFALNYAIVEQVIWYNIQPYLVAIALMLAAILLLLKGTDTTEARSASKEIPCLRGGLPAAWLLTLWATFTYEVAQFFAISAACFLAATPWTRWQKRCWVAATFVAIAVFYQAANFADRSYHTGSYSDDVSLTQLATRACDAATLEHASRYTLYTAVQPFLPCRISVFRHGKIRIAEELWYTGLPWRPTLLLAWSVVAVWVALMLAGMWRVRHRRSLCTALLLAGPTVAQAALIVLGRMNMRVGSTTLCYNSHYAYIGLLFALALSGALLASTQQFTGPITRRSAKVGAALLVLGLLALGVGSGYKVYRVNARIAENCRSYWEALPSLRSYIRAHRHEPNFRYALAWNPPELMPHSFEMPAPFLFYRRYADSEHATHVLWYENNRFTGLPMTEWRASHSQETHLCGDFVQLGKKWQVFHRDGFFYAINFSQIRPFLACAAPEGEDFYRDRDMANVLEWIRVQN